MVTTHRTGFHSIDLQIYYPPQTKLQEGNDFTGVCLSTWRMALSLVSGPFWGGWILSLVPGPFWGGWICPGWWRWVCPEGWVPTPLDIGPSWLIHTARDRDRDRDREMMGFCIMLYTVHTTQGQGQVTIVFYCTHPGPGPCPVPGPVQCE